MMVNTAAPKHIKRFVLSPAALPLSSLSKPITAPRTVAKMILTKSSGQTMALPLDERLIDLHAEVPAGFFDMPQHLIARL